MGFLSTYIQVAQDLFWPKMKHHIKLYIDNFLCVSNTISWLVAAGFLQPL